MLHVADSFEYDYFGTDVMYGRACVRNVSDYLEKHDLNRALVVCGSNVGSNEDVMSPIREGLGNRLRGVFDGTTPAKALDAVYEGIEAMEAVDPDVLVGLGGGSSLDIARQISVFAADGRSMSDIRSAARENGLEPPAPDRPAAEVITIPTTLAGAGLSGGSSVEVLGHDESPTGQPVRARGSITPIAVFYDPALFETTPPRVLTGSSMNGFNKGVDTLYSQEGIPITDATAVHGLRVFREALPRLPQKDPTAVDRAVVGLILVQFQRRLSLIHAVAHGFSRRYPVQQGVIHAIVAPHVLRYVLKRDESRQELLAAGLGLDYDSLTGDELTGEIVDVITDLRDELVLETQLREMDPINRDDLRLVAEFVSDDFAIDQTPDHLTPSVEEIEEILTDAW